MPECAFYLLLLERLSQYNDDKQHKEYRMSELILRDAIADRVIEQARRKGYATPEAFILAILDETEAIDEDIETSFKEGFRDILAGRVMTREAMWKRLAEDE